MSSLITRLSYLNPANAQYIEELYERYAADQSSLDESWAYFFDGLNLGAENASNSQSASALSATKLGANELEAEFNAFRLIEAYRVWGRDLAWINPLDDRGPTSSELEPARFGLSNADLEKPFRIARAVGLPEGSTLSQILATLRETYAHTVAVEIEHVQNPEERQWLRGEIEGKKRLRAPLDSALRRRTLSRLIQSESFERFLHTRYVAKKRFSIEGGEALIPGLDAIFDRSAELGVSQIVIGMAHRGRLNVLTNVFGKKPEYIFSEFEDQYEIDPKKGDGDVKYHMGFSADVKASNGKVLHLSLASNPSHLEFVNPVVEGVARAKQDGLAASEDAAAEVLPILIHGDAAFAGQGVVYETLAFSQLKGYATGGTIHIVINNQVGFTTDAADARSTRYCTDLAKMLDAPILHVNGDDPEAMWRACEIATEYRARFKRDFFIDLVCYRKYGHNEGDEPSFTQPVMYKKIGAHPSPAEVYGARLAKAGVVSEDDYKQIVDGAMAALTQAQTKARAEKPSPYISSLDGRWKGLKRGSLEDMFIPVDTRVSEDKLRKIAAAINTFPAGFKLHSKLGRLFEARLKSVENGTGIDWGCGELLAYASLLADGHKVRLSGQDVERGTFTHRHAVVRDFETGHRLNTLNRLSEAGIKAAPFDIFNSLLSETGALGFEYGYATADPLSLVIWEAQFGDFANGAQVIIDQFIASGESKWLKSNGLVMLLPHGYEGQGPEHSSARLERFLQLCGDGNMVVGNFTTPANLFHALRRQLKWSFRKPMVIMSPKSGLRHPMAISALKDFSDGGFQEVIEDPLMSTASALGGFKEAVFCSGKVYYELFQTREEANKTDVALIRVEQLHPWPEAKIAAALGKLKNVKKVRWVQEEPRNMGAWGFVVQQAWPEGLTPSCVARRVAASPAVGSTRRHDQEQKTLIAEALGIAVNAKGKKP